MIEPTERLLWLIVAVAAVGAVGLALPLVGGAAPVALVGVALFAVVDVFLAGSPARVRLRRVIPERLLEHRGVDVGVVVESDRRVDVEVTDTLPQAEPAWLSHSAVVDAGERVTLSAPVTFLRRGHHKAGRLAVRTRGPLGLVRRRQRRVVDDEFAVASDLALLMAKAERLVRGQDSAGGRRKRAIERGRELDSLREYRRGDDVRLVDWKASARKDATGRGLVVKELVPETRQDVVVIVDAGRQLMGHNQDDRGVRVSRFDVAVQTALVLCAAALQKGDRCGLGALQDELVAWEPPREGKSSLKRVADAVADVGALPLEPAWGSLPGFLSARLKRRALVCVVTDVVDEAAARALAQGLAGLRGRHLVAVLAIGDPRLARLALPHPGVSEVLAPAAARLLEHRKRALKAIEAAGAVVVDAPAARAAALAVDTYLALKGSGRL